MKTLPNSKYHFLTCVNHQDRVFVFALKQADDKPYAEIYYSLQNAKPNPTGETPIPEQDSFDENWRPFDVLTFPTWIRPVGMRLGAYEAAGFDQETNKANTSAVYTRNEAFIVRSDGETITIFRKVSENRATQNSSQNYRIFADRFVYNTKSARLINVNEVRYIRSGSPDVPDSQVDSFGVRSPGGNAFIEPTSEINLDYHEDFNFEVLSVPVIGELYISVWHFFLFNNTGNQIKIFSIPRSISTLFDTSFCKNLTPNSDIIASLKLELMDYSPIYHVDSSLYNQQEEMVNQEGEIVSVKKGTNLMLAVNHHFELDGENSNAVTSIDLDVGVDGYLAGMVNKKDVSPFYKISSPQLDFYGTVLEFDGQFDQVDSNGFLYDDLSDGLTIEVWANFRNDFSKPFYRNLWTITNIELDNGDPANPSYCSIDLNYNNLGEFTLVLPGKSGEIIFEDIPAFTFNKWNHISVQFPPANIANTTPVLLVINDVSYASQNNFDLKFKAAAVSTFTIGSRNADFDNLGNSRFAGRLSEIRVWSRYNQNTNHPYLALSNEVDQGKLLLCEAFSQGSGHTISHSYFHDLLEEGFEITGAQWVSSIVPSRQNMITQYRDNKLLGCSAVLLRNKELQNTPTACMVETEEKPSLLNSADGILRLFYNRTDQLYENNIGVANFDPSVSRYHLYFYWKNETEGAHEENNYLIFPQLILSSLLTGTEMNNALVQFTWDTEDYEDDETYFQISFHKIFSHLNNPDYHFSEIWKKIPITIDNEKISPLDIANIINGQGIEIYDYNNFNRDFYLHTNSDTPAPKDQLASILFEATQMKKDNDDIQQAFPLNPDLPIEDQMLKQVVFGVDSTWVLNPTPAALELKKEMDTRVSVNLEKNLKVLNEDFSFEAWINPVDIQQTGSDLARLFVLKNKATKSELKFDDTGKCYLSLAPKENNGRTIQFESDGILKSKEWQQIAMTYKTGYALNFQTNFYVDIKNDNNLAIDKELTIETWYFLPDDSGNTNDQIIAAKWNKDTKESSWRLIFLDNHEDQLMFQVYDSEKNVFTILEKSQTKLIKGSWNHIAATYAMPTTKNFLCINEIRGDVHFEIPDLSKNIWESKLTIEFETLSDLNKEKDDFTFVAFGYTDEDDDKKNAIAIRRTKYSKGVADTFLTVQVFNHKEDVTIINKDGEEEVKEKETVFFYDEDGNRFDYIFQPDVIAHIGLTAEWIEEEEEMHLTLYIDGAKVATATVDDIKDEIDSIASTEWLIGTSYEEGELLKHFSGYLTDFRIWNVVRTHQQILDNIGITIDVESRGLLALFPMDLSPFVTPENPADLFITNAVTNQNYFAIYPPDLTTDSIDEDLKKSSAFYQGITIPAQMQLIINGEVIETINACSKSDSNTQAATSTAEDFVDKIVNPIYISKSNLTIGGVKDNPVTQLNGRLDNLRIWRKIRLSSQINYYQYNNLQEAIRDEKNIETFKGLVAAWTFDEGRGTKIFDHAGIHEGKLIGLSVKEEDSSLEENQLWVPSNFNGKFSLYRNGIDIPLEPTEGEYVSPKGAFEIVLGGNLDLFIGEVRLWSKALKKSKVKLRLHNTLVGDEKDLEFYWQLSDGSGWRFLDRGFRDVHGYLRYGNSITNNQRLTDEPWVNVPVTPQPEDLLQYPIPVSSDPQSCINISTNVNSKAAAAIKVDGAISSTEYDALTKLFLGYFTKTDHALNLTTEKSENDFMLVYIGQAQYNPKIVGFIEGAPPVPCENLTVDSPINPDKYVGTATVSLTQEGVVNASASHSNGLSGEVALNLYGAQAEGIGTDAEVSAVVVGTSIEVADGDAEFYVNHDSSMELEGEKSKEINASSTQEKEYSLTLGGAWEPNVYNIPGVTPDKLYVQAPRLYRPNNMAVAVVKSRTADLYAIQSRKTRKTVGYKLKLDEKIPEDTNYIMFKLNPAYVNNGSLDGRIGFDNDRQYPELENKPQKKASFYKVQEAYQTQTRIEREQEEWKNYIHQTNDREHSKSFLVKSRALSLANNYVWTADGGFLADTQQISAAHTEQHDSSIKLAASINFGFDVKILTGTAALIGGRAKADLLFGGSYVHTKSGSESKEAAFSLGMEVEGEGFLSMHKNVKTPAPMDMLFCKGNFDLCVYILNQGYNPDFSSESQMFKDALIDRKLLVELGAEGEPKRLQKFLILRTGPYSWSWSNPDEEYLIEAEVVNADVQGGHGSFNFSIRLEEHPGQYPVLYQSNNCPGKVTGYRFKSFYMNADRENFDLLAKGYDDDMPIIDPEWLKNTENPDAMSMRKALQNPNSIWRIFHRVTYVSRVPPSNDIEGQDFDHESFMDQSENIWIDYTSQLYQKPDAISISNNHLLIDTIMGITDPNNYTPIDESNVDYEALKTNINKWISLNAPEDAHDLDGIEKERLFNLMLNYFRGYLLQDSPDGVEQEQRLASAGDPPPDYSGGQPAGIIACGPIEIEE